MIFVHRRVLRGKIDYLRRMYTLCERRASTKRICDLWGNRFRLMAKIYCVVIGSAVFTYILMPLIIYVVFHKVEPVFTMPLPFINGDTNVGYWIENFIHSASLMIAAIGLISGDLTILFLTMHVCLLSDVFVSKLVELQAHIVHRGADGQYHDEKTRLHMCALVRLHHEIGAYETDMAKLFYLLFLVDVVLDWSSMCLCLFSGMLMTFAPLYTEFFGMLLRLMYSCTMGTLVEHYVCGMFNHYVELACVNDWYFNFRLIALSMGLSTWNTTG